MSTDVEKPAGSTAEVFAKMLDAIAAQLEPERVEAMGFPDDELHREILLPLLPAMLGDATIRANWQEQTASGFFARLAAYLHGAAPRPEWTPADFEIHVTASYLAGPDAKALADTLLSEESLRELTAALMNQAAETAWGELPVGAEPVHEAASAAVADAGEPSVEREILQPAFAEAAEMAETEAAEEVSAIEAPAAAVGEALAVDFVDKVDAVEPVPTAMRPKLANLRRNPLAGGARFRRFAFPTWTKANPLSRRPAAWAIGTSRREG